MKKIVLLIFFLGLFAKAALAITLLIESEAVQRIFPDTEQVNKEKIAPSLAQIQVIKGLLVKQGVPQSSLSKHLVDINGDKEVTFYSAKKENKLIGTAFILDEPGKWGPIKYIIRLNPAGGIEAAAVMKYTETRGRPVASQNFLKQFIGKSLNDPLTVGKDIQGVSGATISSGATCFAIKKALVLYRVLVLKEPQ